MKSTESFKKTIHSHLLNVAKNDSDFSKKLMNPKKNIDDCITYILNQVKNSGCNGFEDSEIFGMAIHYYDEKDVKPGNKISGKVVVNHKVEQSLSPKEIEQAKKEAKDKLIESEMEKLRNRSRKQKKESKSDVEPTLFDSL